MSTDYYMIVDAPLAVPPAEADAAVRSVLSEMTSDPDDAWGPMTVEDDLAFLPRTDEERWPPLDADGLAFGPDGVFADLCLSNCDRAFEREVSPGVDVATGRLRIEELLAALGRVVDARPGDVLGGFRSMHGNDLGPILMTDRGPRILFSRGDSDRHDTAGPRHAPLAPVLRSIPADLIRFDASDDAGAWTCSVDLPALRAHAAGATGPA